MQRYGKDPSILRIKQYFKNPTEFSFVAVDKDIIAKEIKNLDTKRAALKEIPSQDMKANS